MDFFTKSQKLFSADGKDDDDDFKSDATSTNDPIDFNDMMGNPEVRTKSGPPSKGRSYLFFTIVMTIILSILVIQASMKTDTPEEQQLTEHA